MSKLEELKSNPLVYYIYQVDCSIFGITDTTPKYIIVVDESLGMKPTIIDGDTLFEVYTTKDWFAKVVNSDIITWICSCIDKKFIVKEYVKLLGMRNDLKIRNNFDNRVDAVFELVFGPHAYTTLEAKQQSLFNLFAELLFSHQILDFNKIINFNEPKDYWNAFITSENPWETFLYLATPLITQLHNRTSNLVKQKTVCQEL